MNNDFKLTNKHLKLFTALRIWRKICLNISLSTVLSSCLYVEDTWKEEVDCEVWTCPGGECCVLLSLDMDDIRACFAAPENLPGPLSMCAEYWDEAYCSLPNCDPPFTVDPAVIESTLTNTPEWAAENCAQDDTWVLDGEGEDALDEWEAELTLGCPIEILGNPELFSCDVVGAPIKGDPCPEGSPLDAPPDIDFELIIDPALSYAQATVGGETEYSPLEGIAFAATNPKRFLLALAWADNFQHAGDSFTYNHLALSAEIELSGSGNTYGVPLNQDFSLNLQGYRDLEEYSIGFEPVVSSGGTFNISAGEWTYHYDGVYVDVHLEGELIGVSP